MEDVAMRTNIDFSPFFRSSIGFDRMFNLLENASRVQAIDHWPQYDIVKTGDDAYRITMAVAGFAPDELNLTQEAHLLMVTGAKSGEDSGDYLHRGIAGRNFQRRFELADYVRITGASLDNGLLTIDLVRDVPEQLKPRKIEISSDAEPRAAAKRIEGKAA